MLFDPDNAVVRLCARGMELEASARPGEAAEHFLQAWKLAASDAEKFTAAHYVARHQPDVEGKLHWDRIALAHALRLEGDEVKTAYPSLYLNIAKCYEELQDKKEALRHYTLAKEYAVLLPGDGYSDMIRRSLVEALIRLSGTAD